MINPHTPGTVAHAAMQSRFAQEKVRDSVVGVCGKRHYSDAKALDRAKRTGRTRSVA